MSANTKRMINEEWFAMKSVKRHGGAATISEIEEDMTKMMKLCPTREEVFNAVSRLVNNGVLEYSPHHEDFVFNPDYAYSRLMKELSRSRLKKIPISAKEWEKNGWRGVAGLDPIDDR